MDCLCGFGETSEASLCQLAGTIAEGLDKRPLGEIVASVGRMRFNCVRLTWSTFMFTRPFYGQKVVSQTLDSLGLQETKEGVAKNNPSILNMTHVQAFEAVVAELGAQGIMVLLDNHNSKPGWCCSDKDGNGFFGDEFFEPQEWINGLSSAAFQFKGNQQVVAIGLRNELRGSRQNTIDWNQNVREGASVVHKTNPDVLVFVSGLNYALDLSFLRNDSLRLDFLDNKLVYEVHWYSFSQDQSIWAKQPTNRVCSQVSQSFIDRANFLNTGMNPVPLVLGEFGYDQRDKNLADKLYMTCLLAYVAADDLDWALWGLQGSYYLRDGQKGAEETYGVLDATWQQPRNPDFMERIKFLQRYTTDPFLNARSSFIMFNPLTGNCVNSNEKNELYGTNSSPLTRWSYDGDGAPIKVLDREICLK